MEKTNEETLTFTPPRNMVYICDRPFWVDAQSVIPMLAIENATKGMDKKDFSSFAGRLGLRIEVWESKDGNTKQVLCQGENVLGDWI